MGLEEFQEALGQGEKPDLVKSYGATERAHGMHAGVHEAEDEQEQPRPAGVAVVAACVCGVGGPLEECDKLGHRSTGKPDIVPDNIERIVGHNGRMVRAGVLVPSGGLPDDVHALWRGLGGTRAPDVAHRWDLFEDVGDGGPGGQQQHDPVPEGVPAGPYWHRHSAESSAAVFV